MKRANTMSTITVELIIKMKPNSLLPMRKDQWIHLTTDVKFHTMFANCHIPSGHWKPLAPHAAELLAGVNNKQDCRAIRMAYCCLNSLRIRVEARANVTERAVISRHGGGSNPCWSTRESQVRRAKR